jgi:CheY-like chemotaxis protein
MTTILIVEHQPVTQRAISLALHSQGYNIVTATDASDAWKKLQQTPVDLALIDLTLPGITALKFLRVLRSDERFSKVPTIMLTNGREDYHTAALSLGADGFLNVAANSHELLDTVSRFVVGV